MMLLLKQVEVLDPNSAHNQSVLDILIKDGKIERMAKNLREKNADTWNLKGAFISPGWLDIGTQVGDPGFEHREDIHSASAAAANGGFTTIACLPNSNPVLDSKAGIAYLSQQSKNALVAMHPIGAVSSHCNGLELTEMYDMYESGACAFSDGKYSIQDAGLLMRALLYVKPFKGLIINRPHKLQISANGQMHEGIWSTTLGMKGIPALAEELMVVRDLYLCEYTDSRIHIANISCARSVHLIREAKAQGIKVSASVNPFNLIFSDEVLSDFDTNYKLMPPLRAKSDSQALIEGLKDDTIDCIVSNHVPLEMEAKKLEFLYAKFGAISLETCYAAINTFLKKHLKSSLLIDKLAIQPRKILGLTIPKLEKGSFADFTIFDPQMKWEYKEKNSFSKSKNTPFLNQEFKGKVLGIIRGDKFHKSKL